MPLEGASDAGRSKKRIRTAAIFCLTVACVAGRRPIPFAAEIAPQGHVLEDFEGYTLHTFPPKWRVHNDEARKIYRLETENDNRFLHAHAEKQSVLIGLEHIFDPSKRRRLHWRWRIHARPPAVDERMPESHDAAAQVYVIFDNQYLPRVIKYIWSATLPIGTRFTHPLYLRGRVIVLRSGSSKVGEWFRETASFYEDYKNLFGEEPGKVKGIAILSSSDLTKSLAIADYDDFILLP